MIFKKKMEIESSLIVKVCGSLNFSGLFPFPRVGRGRETLARAPLEVKGRSETAEIQTRRVVDVLINYKKYLESMHSKCVVVHGCVTS